MKQFFSKYALLLFFCMCQLGYWFETRKILPEMDVVPDVPGVTAVKALSFGDQEFYYRVLGLEIQNAGDTFGRFTELYKYDYKKLYAWFSLLDKLDKQSDYIAFLASYYYSQTQYIPDVRYVVDYLYEHSKDDPSKDFWWLSQAAYCAEHKLGNRDLALKVATPLENAYTAPYWARELPAFIHERRGEGSEAFRIIEDIKKYAQDNKESIPDYEMKFMSYFIEHRLKPIEKSQKKEP